MSDERWRFCLGGYYEVSNYGSVRRLKPGPATWVGRVVKQLTTPDGYKYVDVTMSGERKHEYVHILVAEAFVGPRSVGKEVNHADLDKENNHYKNLEYVTHKTNMAHAIGCGAWDRSRGEDNGNSKLTVRQVKRIRKIHSSGRGTFTSIARDFGLRSCTTVSLIVNRITWTHV